MSIEDALHEACQRAGINPPKGRIYGKWLKTDTQSGKNGKGDGRVILNETHVTAFNWQTGETITVGLHGGKIDDRDRSKIAKQIEASSRKKQTDAASAARIAAGIIAAAKPSIHPYLAGKGFREERALTVSSADISHIAGDRSDYLIGGTVAIVIPARIGAHLSSVQLIWEDGAKKFLFGGTMEGATHRIATGADTWLCEGYATGLSIRAALHGMRVRPTILCCFSAANIVTVAKQLSGRIFIGAERDKPLPQFEGLGTSEHYARQTGLPYGMPPDAQTDFNDMHQRDSIFAVQRVLTTIMTKTGRRSTA